MLATAYRMLTDLGGPVIDIYLRRRLEQGREDRERFGERRGRTSQPRPVGRLVWCHAASLGEAASFLALIERLREVYPQTHILITTGTVTSAKMLAGRLPIGVLHQYVPVDRMPFVRNFLDHWKPDLALWVESELWPNMLAELRARKIPAILLNGAMSENSFRSWYRFKGWAKEILSTFSLCLTQTEDDQSRFAALGAKPVRCVGNLKYAGRILPCDEAALAEIKKQIEDRPVLLFASTHRDEEVMALEAHKKLQEQWPQLLTILVPRHARRGDEVARKISESGMSFARRSQGQVLTAETEIYLADTMGELGLFYRLSRMMVMGGTFVPVGGHNLIEPAQLGCAIIMGPYVHTQSEVAAGLMDKEAAFSLRGENEISFTVNQLLASPQLRDRTSYNARILAEEKRSVLNHVMQALEPWLDVEIRGISAPTFQTSDGNVSI